MENNNNKNKNNDELKLKHLGFVRLAAIKTLMCLSSVYDYAKLHSGPFRSSLDTVEGAVITPVLDKFKDVPDCVLAFLDQKVDVATTKFDKHAPPMAKLVVNKVKNVIGEASQLAKEVIHAAEVGGPLAAAHLAANESMELVLKQSVKVWSKLDQLPIFHVVFEIIVPTAAHWSEKYNKLVTNMRGTGGNAVFTYFPLVPIDEISKAFKQIERRNESEGANSSNEVDSQ